MTTLIHVFAWFGLVCAALLVTAGIFLFKFNREMNEGRDAAAAIEENKRKARL